MSYTQGSGATMKLATQKLDNLWYVKSYGGMQNDPERPRRLADRVEFSHSLTAIAVLEQKGAIQAKASLDDELGSMTRAVRIKLLKKNNDVSRLTKKESASLWLTCLQ
jgi:hypothetical protein